MCKSQAEGGQRCYSHTAAALNAAKMDYLLHPDGEHCAAVIDAYITHASTPRGQQEIQDIIATPGAPGPVGLEPGYWLRIAGQGDMLRERNHLIAAATAHRPPVKTDAPWQH